MRLSRILLCSILAPAISHAHGQTVFNCSTFNTGSGTCGANTTNTTLGGNNFFFRPGPTSVSSGQVQLAPAATSHAALAMNYTTAVNVQSFTTTYTFVPSGNIIAFVLQNTSNQPGYQGVQFVAGAGCEGGFFQASNVGVGGQSPNNVFALTMDGFNYLTPTDPSFTYSGTALYQATQDPCKPNDGDPVYIPVNNISTSPVALNSPANTPNTTTGHTYSVTINYDGSNVVESLYDVTAGGSCPGVTCFTHTWTGINIPSIVGGSNTALVGITGSTISAGNAGPSLLKTWSYTATPVIITANKSPYGFVALPGDQRQINVNITNGTTNKVNWSVLSTTGGATAFLSATTNTWPWVTVTLGAPAGTCSTPAGSSPTGYVLSSTATVTIQAQSVDDTSKTANFTFNVCAKSTQVFVTPSYETLYANQPADLQSWVFGNSNQAVTWAITSQPGGGDGTLADTTSRDAYFKATVAGRYTLTATSVADGTKTASAVLYVTGHALTYAATPEKTIPVDCSVDPALTGHSYTVGPGKTYSTIAAALTAVRTANDWTGSTVLIYNTDVTGNSPTTYHEWFNIPQGGATSDQPIRVCGVPDSLGNLPVIDATNATTSTWSTSQLAGFGAVILWPERAFGTYWSMNPIQYNSSGSGAVQQPTNVIIEGLHIKNATSPNQYFPAGSGTLTTYVGGAACITSRQGYNHLFRGNDLEHCDNGTLTDFNANNSGWGIFNGLEDWEGNHFHDNSITSIGGTTHQLYIQAWYQLVQENVIDSQNSGGGGGSLKDRGVGTVVRYNYLDQEAGGRVLDATDQQDATQYIDPDKYMNTGALTGSPDMPANIMAAWNSAFHTYHYYGNADTNTTALTTLHYMGDHGQYGYSRPGWLYAYNNTSNQSLTGAIVLDLDDAGGSPYEYPSVLAQNNIFWATNITFWGGGSQPCWDRTASTFGTFTTNLIPASPNALTNISTPISQVDCNAANGWNGVNSTVAGFTSMLPINNHLTGLTSPNFMQASVQPFNASTFVPVSGQERTGTVLGSAVLNMPVRFNATTGSSFWNPRSTTVTSSAAGIVGAVDSGTSPTAATPTFSPSAGTYTSIQTVTISDTTPSSTIYYTVDGSTPTTGSTVYTTPVSLNQNTTVKAIAAATGYTNSAVGSAAYVINLSGLWNSLAGWQTCIMPGCDPGGTGTPVSTNNTIRNATPSLSGSSMLFSLTANTADTNALWSWFDADCDLCTNFSSDFEVYPVSSSNLGAVELDTAFLFSVGLNREYMWGMQYCLIGAGCPGGHNSWDIWDQATLTWIDSGVTQAPNFGAWNHIQTTNHRSGNSQIYDTLTINGTLHNLNITQNSSVLPMGWTSGTGFQFQLDAATTTGTQTFTMYLDQATFSASGVPPSSAPTNLTGVVLNGVTVH